MNKLMHALAAKPAFTDFVDKLTARWQLRLQPNTPSHVTPNEQPEQILADLVAIPTISGNREALTEGLDYLEEYLKKCGMFIERPTWNGVESLIATTRNTKQPTVFLAGHLDVVPAPADMFTLREQDGRYYGRGALDMKCALAGYLGAIQHLPGKLTDYDFGIMVMVDEETGSFDSSGRLAEAGYLPKVMVLPDGGDNWNMELTSKATWWITLTAAGKSSHGSRPWEGDNALDRLLPAIQQIKALFPAEQTADTNTITLGMIRGGKAINQVPSASSASIDMRFTTTAEQQAAETTIRTIAKQHQLDLVVEFHAEGTVNDPDNPYLHIYRECTQAATGVMPQWVTSNGGSDARFFTSYGIPVAIGYPAGGGHHGPGEYVEKQAFFQFIDLIGDFLQRVAYDPSSSAPSVDVSQTHTA